MEEMEEEEELEYVANNSVGDHYRGKWLMGNEGRLMMEVSPLSPGIRITDPGRGVDVEVTVLVILVILTILVMILVTLVILTLLVFLVILNILVILVIILFFLSGRWSQPFIAVIGEIIRSLSSELRVPTSSGGEKNLPMSSGGKNLWETLSKNYLI